MGSIGFLLDFEFSIAFLVVGSGTIELVAPCRFKTFDSRPVRSNMGTFPIDFDDFRQFQKSRHGFLAWHSSCFRPGRLEKSFFKFFDRSRKDARRKVTQIRDGVTSGSAFFDIFIPI